MIYRLSENKYNFLVVGLVAAFIRTYFIIFFPEAGGDGKTYTLVAENILTGCGVSISEIGSNQCVPHFGGNQGPGYPTFIAIVWALSGHSDLAVRLVQAFFCIAAILYIMDAIYLYKDYGKLAMLVGLFLHSHRYIQLGQDFSLRKL